MGGIKALAFEAMFGTFKINWLKTYLSQPDSMWFHIPRNLFKQVGGLDFLLHCDFKVTKIPVVKIPQKSSPILENDIYP